MRTITLEEYEEVKQLSKKNKDKRLDKKLSVILLRYEGYSTKEIAVRTGYSAGRVSVLIKEFKEGGAAEYVRNKYQANNQKISPEREKELLDGFRKQAEAGQVVTVAAIKAAFDKERGSVSGSGYIYMVLSRLGWRKVMPRSEHPNKATDEDIEASKKLTLPTMK